MWPFAAADQGVSRSMPSVFPREQPGVNEEEFTMSSILRWQTPAALVLSLLFIACGSSGGGSDPGACGTGPADGGSPADTVPPSFAGAASATGGENSVILKWSAATDNVTAPSQIVYLLYQAGAAGGEDFTTPTYTSAAGATSYNVGKLLPSTTYYFVVRARDQAGNIDMNQVEVSAATLSMGDTTPPVFAGIKSAVASGNDIVLSWIAATDNATPASQITYLVYQAGTAGGENYAMPSYTTAPGATSYSVSGLNSGSTYYFVVRAEDAAGNSDTNTTEASAAIAGNSFSGQVQPILSANCGGGGCHSGSRPAQGLNLSSASVSYGNLVNVASSECSANKRVLPSQPAASYLISKLKGSGSCYSGSKMPIGGSLSTADISLISAWIAAGAPNN